MAARSPKRDEALRRYLASEGKLTATELAEMLDVSMSQIRKWKSQDKWEATLALPPEERNVPKHIGAPFGNKNAVGNPGGHGTYGNQNAKGHGAPLGNKNNLRTGEYETISLDVLTDDEKDFYDGISCDPIALIDENIKLLKIRERRMLQRLTDLNEQKDKISLRTTYAEWGKHDDAKEPKRKTVTEQEQFLLDKILALEDALSRVQDRIMRAVDTKLKLLDDIGGGTRKEQITFSFSRGDNSEPSGKNSAEL